MHGVGDGQVPGWWRGYDPAAPGFSLESPRAEGSLSGAVAAVDLASMPLDDSMLRHVSFAHARVRRVDMPLDEVSFLASWSTLEDCVFRQRSTRLHPDGDEPGGLLAWRPTVYRRCRFAGVRFGWASGFSPALARFEDCVFERCKWNINLHDLDMIRCRIAGPMTSVVFFGYSNGGADGLWRKNEFDDNDFTAAVMRERGIGFRHNFPIDAQRWPPGFTPAPDPDNQLSARQIQQIEAGTQPSPKRATASGTVVPIREPLVSSLTPAPVGLRSRAGAVLAEQKPRSLVLGLDTLPIPSGRASPYGSALRPLGDGSVATSWVAGVQADRVARIDPSTGGTTVLKGARGALRDVVTDPAGERAWLLMTHGLHEVTLSPFAIRRTLGRPLLKYPNIALRLDEDVILVSHEVGRVAQLVSTATMQVLRRVHVAAPQLALPTADGTDIFGFGARQTRRLTNEHRPTGKRRQLPLGRDPLATERGIAYLPAQLGARFNEEDISDREDLHTRADPVGNVAFLNPNTLSLETAGPDLGVGSLHGLDAAGRIIASDHGHDPEPGTTVALLDNTAHHVEGILTLPAQLDAIAPIPHRGAVIRPFGRNRTPKHLWVVEWEQAT